MAYRIEVSRHALEDVALIVDYIAADSPQNAYRWRTRLFQKIAGIDTFPRSCALAPENAYSTVEVRQFVFGSYRVLFTIDDENAKVRILRIRHGARRFMSGDELGAKA